MNDFKIHTGDCLEVLKTLKSENVNCCVTSPPYFRLRDYGHPDQIGLEDSVDEFVKKLIEVFKEVKRVLKDDGTLWLNLGDSFTSANQSKTYFHNKNILGIPWKVAFALQNDGWILRQDIIWHKTNPMPESVQDRCTKSHEYIFLLSKSPKYFYDHEVIKEPCISKDNYKRDRINTRLNQVPGRSKMQGLTKNNYVKKNKRSVWSIPNKPYKGAHFAVFPEELIRPCIKAGCPENGTVLDPFCGSGTTGLVARQENKNFIGIELNPAYVLIAESRIGSGLC